MGHQILPIAFSPDRPHCHDNKIWDKIGYSSACVRNFCKIFAPIGGLWRWAIKCCQLHFPPTDSRCHGNEIWDKIGYNSACVRNFGKILRLEGCFQRWAIKCCQLHFPLSDPCCHDNEIWVKIGYNSICVKDFCKIFASMGGVSEMGHQMPPIAFSPIWPPLHGKALDYISDYQLSQLVKTPYA